MKRLIGVILAVLLIFTLTACNGADELSVKEITTQITSELDLSGFTNVKGETLSRYFGFKSADIESFSFLVSEDEAKSEMIAAFEYKDNDGKKLIIDGIGNYFLNKASVLKDNVTAEYEKIQSRLIYEYKNIIVLVVCDDTESARTVLEGFGATELK